MGLGVAAGFAGEDTFEEGPRGGKSFPGFGRRGKREVRTFAFLRMSVVGGSAKNEATKVEEEKEDRKELVDQLCNACH